MRGLACDQAWGPVCGPGADQPGRTTSTGPWPPTWPVVCDCGWITAAISNRSLPQPGGFWGIKPSFAFVEQPQTNGVAERFNRTLKEQAIYGRIFRNTEDVRRAVGKFVEDYNAQWRVEKNGFLSPRQARMGSVCRREPLLDSMGHFRQSLPVLENRESVTTSAT